jgi:hypothetical protein
MRVVGDRSLERRLALDGQKSLLRNRFCHFVASVE